MTMRNESWSPSRRPLANGGTAAMLEEAVREHPYSGVLVGAGVGWLLGLGISRLVFSGSSNDGGWGADDPYRNTMPRGYVPGGVAGQGYPPAQDAPLSTPPLHGRPAATAHYARDRMSDMADRASSAAGSVADRASSAAGSMTDRAGAMASRMAGQAGAMTDRLSDQAGAMADQASSAASGALSAASRAMSSAYSGAAGMIGAVGSAGHRVSVTGAGFAGRHPLALCAVGVALGAAIGLSLPVTETEKELLGETADALKERVQDLAVEQYEKAKTAVEEAYEEALDEAEAQGFDRETANRVGSQVGTAAQSAKDSAEAVAQRLTPGKSS